MWIFRLHQHINPQVLSEYLDGRLQGAARDRVARRLASCAVCREELESLLATVGLLRQVPVAAPLRSFTMAAPPAPLAASLRRVGSGRAPLTEGKLQRVRHAPLPLRMPPWVYAGAASVAVLVLAIVVSADATGLLAPETQPATRQVSPTTVVGPEPSVPSEAGARAAPAQVPAQVTSQVDERQAIVEKAGPPPPPAAPSGWEVRPTPAPVVAALPTTPAPESVAAVVRQHPDSAAPDLKAVSSQTPQPKADGTPGPPAPALAAGKESKAPPDAVFPPGTSPAAAEPSGGTATVWRILEGVAVALALVFLTGLVLNRWLARRARA